MPPNQSEPFRILFPLASSGSSRSAVLWADHLAAALKAELTLLRVLPESGLALRADLDQGLELARADLAGDAARFQRVKSPTVEVVRGAAGSAITERARSHDVTLLVGDLRWEETGAVSGNVAAQVIRDSGAPVLVIPSYLASRVPHLPRNVLVPVDGTERSARIVPLVGEIARRLQAAVILFSAVPPKHDGRFLDGVAAHLRTLSADLRRSQVATRTVTRLGQPGAAIVGFAIESQADLIAMSTAGPRDADRPGSVTECVFARSQIPVLALYAVDASAGAAPEDGLISPILAEPTRIRSGSALPVGVGRGTTLSHAW